jgi:iron complex outermembrane receptor protein
LNTPSARLLALAATLAGSAPALAEEARGDGARRALEEVVVTARRREEGLQEAPLAVSAYSGESLEYRGVERLDQVAKFVPGLTLENNPSFGGASNSAAIYLRGVGQKEFLPTTEPGVGLYVDGVYVARSVGAILDLVDVERLEVLRGPQGTLFGRNTIGGAIALETVKPRIGAPTSGELSVAGGTDSRLDVAGHLETGLGDAAAARLSLARLSQDGYVERTDGTDLGDDDTLAARLAVAIEPTASLAIDLSLDYSRDRENGPPMELVDIDFTDLSQLQGVVAAPPPPMAFIHNVTAGATAPGVPCAVTDPAGNGITSAPNVPTCYDSRYIGADGEDAGTAPAFSETDVRGASARVTWSVNDWLEVRSITAWRSLEAEFARDGDHSPFRIAHFRDDLEQDQFSQELQIVGTHERGDWILGLYWFEEDGDNENVLDFTVSNFRSGGAFDNEALAVFAQGTLDLTDRLHLTVGGRWTDETKSFAPDQVILTNYFAGISAVVPPGNPLAALDAPFLQAGSPVLPAVEREIDFDEFTPMVNLSFDVTDEVLVYASFSEGFKSGGFTQRVFPPVVAGFTAPPGTPDQQLIPIYDPEFVDVFELGLKSTFLDGRVRLNAAAYRTLYDDLQVQVFDSVAPVTRNIGEATIDGLEAELVAAPGDGWLIEASAAWTDAGYDEIDTATTLIGEDFDFERVPETTFAVGVSKEFAMGRHGTLVVRTDLSYRDETFNDAFNTPQLRQDDYTLVDASVRWEDAAQRWAATLSGRNLGDEEYLVTGVYGTAFQAYEGMFDRGRQWRLELTRRF